MNKVLKTLEEVRIEDWIWIIYLFLASFALIANFFEKDYDHTTIQDIVDALGISKGAVCHHFKSKEEILDRITGTYYDDVNWFHDIRLNPNLNSLQKLREILYQQFTDSRKHDPDLIPMDLHKNSRVIALTLQSTMQDAAPFFNNL